MAAGFLQRLWYSLNGTSIDEAKVTIRQHDLTDCGAACLASIAVHYGLQLPIARIRQLASTDQKGTNVLGLVEASQKLGFSAKAVKGDAAAVFEVPVPAIAHAVLPSGLHHYVVLYKAGDDGVKVMDPAKGTMETMSRASFESISTGVFILLAPERDFRPGDERVSVLQRFAYLIRPHRRMMLQVMLGAIVFTLLGFASAIYLRKIIDNVIPDENQNLLNLLSLLMVLILLAQIFINRTRTILTIQTGQQIDARLILGYYKHLLRLPQSFFDTMRVGEIISRMNDAVKIRTFINDVLVSFFVNVFILFFSLVLMFTSYWKLGLVMFAVLPAYAVVYFLSNRLNRYTQRRLMEDSADLQAQLVESVNSVGTIKRFGLEDFANVKTETRFIKLLRTIFTSATNNLWVGNASTFVSGMFTIILLWVGTTFVLRNELSPGELLSYYAIVGYFTGPVLSLIGMNNTMQQALIAADRLFEIMDLEREDEETKTELRRDMMGDIVFKDVAFRYGTRVNVFEHLNLTIKRGEVTAIVGESGSGKTTLLSLLQAIYPLQAGHITIGNLDIRYISNSSLRSLVSVVPQQIDLFAGNVVENIAVGEYEPELTRIIDICRSIGILDFIESLPAGFKTQLGERGATLSGGQRQRIAIARALYKDPEILIMDEATSSLDSLSEQSVQQVVRQLRDAGKTIILIAHRLSTVLQADKIVVMRSGEVVEEGSHSELLASKAAYYTMWEQQFPMIGEISERGRG
jgi:ABC-type bacteriocin transporter